MLFLLAAKGSTAIAEKCKNISSEDDCDDAPLCKWSDNMEKCKDEKCKNISEDDCDDAPLCKWNDNKEKCKDKKEKVCADLNKRKCDGKCEWIKELDICATSLGFDPKEWIAFDVTAQSFDAGYVGNYETINTTAISDMYTEEGSVFIFDLGSFGSLTRRRGSIITLSEIRTIWYELSPIVGDNAGIVMKSVGDSLQLYFNKVSDGLTATRAMYFALIARWQKKVALACDNGDPPTWCGDEEEERKLFFNTAAVGGGYGEMLIIPDDGTPVDAIGAAVNNAYFAGEEEAEHGETIIDEGALQSLLAEAEGTSFNACVENSTIPWTAEDFGIDHFITRSYYNFSYCYYTVCFDAECKIPDDE